MWPPARLWLPALEHCSDPRKSGEVQVCEKSIVVTKDDDDDDDDDDGGGDDDDDDDDDDVEVWNHKSSASFVHWKTFTKTVHRFLVASPQTFPFAGNSE